MDVPRKSSPVKAKITSPVKETRKENVQSLDESKSSSLFKIKSEGKSNMSSKAKLLDNEDHNYSDLQLKKTENVENVVNMHCKSNIIYSKVSNSGKEKYIGLKITNLSDLKKATPHLKLPAILSSPAVKRTPTVPEEVKQKLHKYCRTCAGLKVPLVDIFSEKGVQMRLSQQIQHLEDINEHDSLSTQMCMDCICDMKMSYKFFMQIKKAEMKLKSLSNSLIDGVMKSNQGNTEHLSKTKNNVMLESSVNDSFKTNSVSDSDEMDSKSKIENYSYSEMNDTCNDENDSLEEFDPDNHDANENNSIKNEQSEIFSLKGGIRDKNSAYKYDESVKAYIKIKSESSEEKQSNDEKKITHETTTSTCTTTTTTATTTTTTTTAATTTTTTTTTTTSESANSGSSYQSSKIPSILKRKLSSGNTSDDSNDKINKLDLQKLNIDLKDIKIPKLDLQDPANIKTEENGVMYVTAKGSKPNEMLLIKVKKVDKVADKKADKAPGKKKSDLSTIHKIIPRYDSTPSKKDSFIEEQIEQYKKKRVEVLGETAIMSEECYNEEEPEIRAVGDSNLDYIQTYNQAEENAITETNEEGDDITEVLNEIPTIAPQYASRLEKIKQRWKDVKKRHDDMYKDLAEDCTERLRAVLRQKDEYIHEFVNYLKQRRIVVSRLQDEDIISLYEVKNNVVLERFAYSPAEDPLNSTDPFEFVPIFECDFCDLCFPDRDMEFEHAKIHDFKLMHYCEDCKQEFSTHKAKRSHNITCMQKLMCRYCDMILESKGKKRQHEQKHCDDQNGQLCDLCGEKFKHQGTLDQHVKSRHMQLEKIFKCPQCPKKFAFRTKLTFHLKTVHTTTRPYLCEDCGSDFKNPASLRHHRIRKHQTVNNKKECSVCNKLIPIYSMSKHMHTHKSYSIECPHCDKMFKNTSTLKQHVRIHEDQRQYKCDMCGVGFNRRDGLRLHLKVHEKSDSRGLKECSCQVCGEKFPNHSMLVIHRNRAHKDGRNYTCHICNRSMISTRSLEWHLSHIHNETLPGTMKDNSSIDAETKRVSCYHCNKTFKTEMILRTHVKNTHVEKEPMKCLDCDMMFTSEVRLKHHMMVSHNRLEGTLTCPHCPKRFVNQLRLKTHMISHSDERPHTCDLCGFMLKTKIQLIKHKQNRHSNERPLQCKYCSWRCKQVSALVCHERTHTNERPYSCSVCNQKFKYLGDKNKHERRHESLGGTGFKRIVTGRNSNKSNRKKEEDSEQDTEPEQEEFEEFEEHMEHMESELETFEETQIIKFETREITEESEASFERIYVEETSRDSNASEVVIGMEDTTVYTEEVTADHLEPEIITNEMLHEGMLQPGTVVHLQQEDETGKIQVIPVMLSLPDLSDGNSETGIATASIMYSN